MEREGYNAYEPPPVGEGTVILPLVLADLSERAKHGREKYGTMLRAHNGRDALVDAYQEAMDLVMYLRQAIEERGGLTLDTRCPSAFAVEDRRGSVIAELPCTEDKGHGDVHANGWCHWTGDTVNTAKRITRCETCEKWDALNWHDGGLHCRHGEDAYVLQNVCARCGGVDGVHKVHGCRGAS